jgi:aryl-alcohol dehydrogenase-like predicted oxidoreductase
VVTLTRRDGLALTLAAGAATVLGPRRAFAQQRLITRPIPATGEQLPVIGLGSSATFSQVARSEDVAALREVLTTLVGQGGTVFDTAPGYGASEEVAGRIVNEAGLAPKVFWATKLNVARGGGPADPAAARAQLAQSLARIDKPRIDLVQVHNVGDPATQIPILKEAKAAGRVRYIGITSTSESEYPTLMSVMRNEPIDFIGIDYAIDNREVETAILPLARERKIGVFVYAPFGRTRLFRRVGDRPLPDWAAEFDARTWAQFFLKFVVAHPAVTVVTPATSQARNMLDNLGGGVGRLPDEATRRRMVAYVEALPQA